MTDREPHRPPATVHDVAARAKVSTSSISNYFHHPRKLSAATRERIAAAMEELGFAPNEAGRTLRTGRNPVVGYVAFELSSARTPMLATAMRDRLADSGYHLVLAVDHAEAELERSYLRLFERQRMSGLIVSPLGDIEPELARLRRNGLPSVQMSLRAHGDDQPSVSIDHRAGGRLAAEHLLQIGRRRIGFVTDDLSVPQIAERLEGARGAIAGSGLVVLPAPERSVAGGVAAADAVHAAVARGELDAVFCVNDLVAIGLVHGLRGRVDIPRQLAVIGYDDIEFATTNRIPLTTVHSPQEGFATTAVDLLLEEIAGRAPTPRPHLEFEPTLVVRESTVGPS